MQLTQNGLRALPVLAACQRQPLKLDAEHPRLVDQILQTLNPNFHSPVPSAAIMRLAVDPADPNLARGFEVARGAAVRSLQRRGQDTFCEFRTAHDLTLWPLEIAQVEYFSHAADLPLTQVIVRSSANIQSGGKSKLSAVLHGVLMLVSLRGKIPASPNRGNLLGHFGGPRTGAPASPRDHGSGTRAGEICEGP